MKRDRDPYVRQSDLKQGEPFLRYMAALYIEEAEKLEAKAAIARENARRCLEAAERRATEEAGLGKRSARRAGKPSDKLWKRSGNMWMASRPARRRLLSRSDFRPDVVLNDPTNRHISSRFRNRLLRRPPQTRGEANAKPAN